MREKKYSPQHNNEALEKDLKALMDKFVAEHLSRPDKMEFEDEKFARMEIQACLLLDMSKSDFGKDYFVMNEELEKACRGAENFLTALNYLRKAVRSGKAERAAACGILIGGLKTTYDTDSAGIYEYVKLYHNSRMGALSGGKTRGNQQTTTRQIEWEKWQAVANELWKKHPDWSVISMAVEVQKQFPSETVRTIRLRIIKPSS